MRRRPYVGLARVALLGIAGAALASCSGKQFTTAPTDAAVDGSPSGTCVDASTRPIVFAQAAATPPPVAPAPMASVALMGVQQHDFLVVAVDFNSSPGVVSI